MVTEQRAMYVTGNLGDALGLVLGPSLALAAAVVVGVGAVALIARRRATRCLRDRRPAACRAGSSEPGRLALARRIFPQQLRAQFPENLSWVDSSAKGPVTRMFIYQSSPLFQEADLFNASIEQDLAPTQRGPEIPPPGSCVCFRDR